MFTASVSILGRVHVAVCAALKHMSSCARQACCRRATLGFEAISVRNRREQVGRRQLSMQKGGSNTGSYRLITGGRGNVTIMYRMLSSKFTMITDSYPCHIALYRCKTGLYRGKTPLYASKLPCTYP